MHYAQKHWLSHFGIKSIAEDEMEGWVDFDLEFTARSREETLRLWLEFEPDDADLEHMTLEEVWAIWHIRMELRGSGGELDRLPERWQAIRDAERYQQSYEGGEKSALMQMLAACARTGMRIPKWAADALCDEVQSVGDHEKGTWDEVFGRPVPKGAHLSAMARRKRAYYAMLDKFRQLQVTLDLPLEDQHELGWGKIPGVAIDDTFFDELGSDIGVSRTVAKELYYEHKQYTHRVRESLKRAFASRDEEASECRENDRTSGNTDD